MFDRCYVRIGRKPLSGCLPLTVSLLGSLYALPAQDEATLRDAVAATIEGKPWTDSFSVAPEQTVASIGAMLRQLMLATTDLDVASIRPDALPLGSRARLHLEALRDLWDARPDVMPADLRQLRAFLTCERQDALQPVELIWDRDKSCLTPLERTVLERLAVHHGCVACGDADFLRLIGERTTAAAPAETLAGAIQRNLLAPSMAPVPADDSFALLSVRDSRAECEAAAAIIQHWLASDVTLNGSDIGVFLPVGSDYARYLSETLARAGIPASALPMASPRRNLAAEVVLHFIQCRRKPAPAMALASLYTSPLLCWPLDTGAALARRVMEGDFSPRFARGFTGRATTLMGLIRASAPATLGQLKGELRQFQKLLTDNDAFGTDVAETQLLVGRLISGLDVSADPGEPDWDKVIGIATAVQDPAIERGGQFLGAVAVMLSHEAPMRNFRKVLVLGFNDGRYPVPPSGNPFFLDSELELLRERAGLELPSQGQRIQEALDLFVRQLRSSREQIVLLLSERDRAGKALSPSSSLPLLARLIAGIDEPEKLVVPLSSGAGTIWDRLIDWRPAPAIKAVVRDLVPSHFDLGIDLLALRTNDDGTLKPQSPSRLETLLVSPLAWLLSEIQAEHVSWQPESLDVLLRGSLAHEVFERLFEPGTEHPDDERIRARVPELLTERIRAIAPFLQMPVWAVERRALESEIVTSALHWAQVLKSLDAEVVGNEFWLAGSLFGHPVQGKADCLLRLPDGQPLVVDYKKSSSGTRRKRLEKHWDLQVDLYRRMDVRVKEESNAATLRIADAMTAWKGSPGVAYHMLNDGGLLVNGTTALENVHVENIPGDIAENALQLIEARFAALRAGRLETNGIDDAARFKKEAALGTYALEDSPLVAAFLRNEEPAGDDDD